MAVVIVEIRDGDNYGVGGMVNGEW